MAETALWGWYRTIWPDRRCVGPWRWTTEDRVRVRLSRAVHGQFGGTQKDRALPGLVLSCRPRGTDPDDPEWRALVAEVDRLGREVAGG